MAFKLSKRGLIVLLAMLPFVGLFGWDFYHKVTETGIYRSTYRGTVVKTRRTLLGYIDIIESCSATSEGRRRHRHSTRRSGNWVARVRADDGRETDVAISQQDYHRLAPGWYIIGEGGAPRVFRSKAEAEAAARPAPAHSPSMR